MLWRDHLQLAQRIVDPTAKYLEYRRVLVDWMCDAGEWFRLTNSTMHVAVGYLDRILQQVPVAKNRLQLVAMCCIIIAGKYEEAEENVPGGACALRGGNATVFQIRLTTSQPMQCLRSSSTPTTITGLR